MAVDTEVSQDGEKLTIKVKGRFDLGKHLEFLNAYEHQLCATSDVV